MKRTVLFLLLIAITASFSSCEKEKSHILYDKKYVDEIKKVREVLALYLTINAVPGATVAVMKEGKIIYSEGIGWASKELEVPVERDTKFRVGNLSEIYTSFMYLHFAQKGILHPDSSIQHYLPDFPEKEHRITLKHLAYQVSGFRDENSREENWRASNVSILKGLETFRDDPLLTAPDLYQSESMFNYNLLGAIMEKATNQRFDKLFKEYISDTLKLNNTLIDNPAATIKGRSDFFDHNMVSYVINASARDLRYCAPSRGILSNAEDLVKFGHAVLHSELLNTETRKNMFNSIPLFDDIPSMAANGWLLMEDKYNNTIYGKSGIVTGGCAGILVYPELDLVVACTTNLSTSANNIPIFGISHPFIPKPDGEQEAQE